MRTLAVVTVVGVYGICTATAPALTELVRENRVAIDAGSAPARTVDNHSVSLTPAGHGEAVGGRADLAQTVTASAVAHQASAPSTFIDLEDGAVGRALRFEEWCALNADEGAYITRWPVD